MRLSTSRLPLATVYATAERLGIEDGLRTRAGTLQGGPGTLPGGTYQSRTLSNVAPALPTKFPKNASGRSDTIDKKLELD